MALISIRGDPKGIITRFLVVLPRTVDDQKCILVRFSRTIMRVQLPQFIVRYSPAQYNII